MALVGFGTGVAAMETESETLFSEDFQHGRAVGTVTIINPFL